MRALKESRESAEEDGDGDNDGRIIREGWGRVLEAVPRAGVAELDPSSSSSRRHEYGRASDVNGKHSLEFPTHSAVPRRSFATASASAAPASSSLSSSLPPSSFDPMASSRDSPPPPRMMDSFDDSFAESSLVDSQDTWTGVATKRKHDGEGEVDGRRKRPSPVPAAAPKS